MWEVQIGKVDLCVGDFWEMPARRRLAPFTSVMALDRLGASTLLNRFYLTESFHKVVLQRSIPAQIRQLVLYISHSK